MGYRLRSSLAPKAVPPVSAADIDAVALSIPPYAGGFTGRGITVCAGGFTYFSNAWVLVRMLRKLGCQLPIQFWHHGDDELSHAMRKLVEPYGVECVDAQRKAESVGRRISKGWPLKPFAVLHSPFEDVLALDADNVPIRNPEYLFGYDAYVDTGAIFWPDVARTEPTRAIWDLMGVPFRSEPEFESGQLVINKALSWEPMNLAMWMNESERAEFFYKIIWGDKDTFRFAWHKFGFPFAMPEVPLQMLSVVGGPPGAGVMCQHDLDGERLFQHRNLHKWELFADNPWVPGFLFEGECREFLAELRCMWNGRIRTPPPQPLANVERMRELQRHVWLLETVDIEPARAMRASGIQGGAPAATAASSPVNDPWPEARQRDWREVRFFDGGHCGSSSSSRVTFWDLEEQDGTVRLTLAGAEGAEIPTAELELTQDGSWRGRSVGGEDVVDLRLVSVEKAYPSAANRRQDPLCGSPASIVRMDRSSGKLPVLRVFNSARGIGDHVAALYCCVGAANAGREVIFHTRFPQWIARAAHPGVTITGDLLSDATEAIDMNHDPVCQLRYAGNKARWYADAIAPGLEPGRPAWIDRSVRVPRFDFDRYVVLAPFSAWVRRDWPGANWTRLTHLLREAGYEVVAIGIGADAERFEQVFAQTTALWAIDHPPEWVMDAMLGAALVIGNDSGMVHLAGLLGVPTLALHSHLPPEFLFGYSSVTSLTPQTKCVFCRWQPDGMYTSACDTACSALATVGPEEVIAAVSRISATTVQA